MYNIDIDTYRGENIRKGKLVISSYRKGKWFSENNSDTNFYIFFNLKYDTVIFFCYNISLY